VELSRRLVQVLVLVGGRGWSYKRVARELGVTYSTVVMHTQRLRDRSHLEGLPPRAALAQLYQQDPERWDDLYQRF
jgi:DNA-binding NarL/FixJ family response regulator